MSEIHSSTEIAFIDEIIKVSILPPSVMEPQINDFAAALISRFICNSDPFY